MDAGLLDRALADANPWWRDVAWAERDVQLRRLAAAPFLYDPQALADLVPGGLYLLRGPRRVGKSTELKRTIARLLAGGVSARSIVYVSVEGWAASDLEQLLVQASGLLAGEPGQGFWFVDEVTATQGSWPAVVKRLRDGNLQFSEDTVVLSGSSATQLEEATKALAGRRGRATGTDRVLLQMPFADVARALGTDVPTLGRLSVSELTLDRLDELARAVRPFSPGLVTAWERYLQVGGYPQAVEDVVRRGGVAESLTDALFEVVHGDALVRARLSPAQTVAGLRSLSRSLASTLSVASVANDMDGAQGAVRARLEDLRRSFLAFPVHREQGLAPRPRSQAKWYFTDPLLATLAARRGAGGLPDVTALSEQQLAVSLLRSLERESPSAALRHDQLLHYRSATGAEIDFVAAAFDGVSVESKYVDRTWGRAFQTIASSPYRVGVVATRSGMRRHDHGWALPAGVLAALLDG